MSRSLPDRPDWRPQWIVVGRVGRAHGLDGSVTLTGHGGVVPLDPGCEVRVGDQPARIVARKGTAERPILRFDLAADRESAELLRGLEVTVPSHRLPEPAADEFFHVDLIGCEVHLAGRPMGRVTAVHEYPANDVLELDSGALIPFVDEVVERVDPPARRIEVRAGVL